MAIYAYAKDAEDFTTAGLAGELLPTSCTHEEYAGGASELMLEHPLDEWGKWECLAAGVILKAPTPVRTTPQFSGGSIVTQVEKWTVKTAASKEDRCICSDSQLRRKRCLVPGGTELTVAGRNETIAKVKSGRYGNGYMKLSALNYEAAETIADDTDSIEAVEGAWSVRDQLFRIYKVEKSDERVTAWAKRIFYDLAEIVTDWHCTTPHTAQQALDGVLTNAMQEHPFAAFTNSGNQRTGLYYERKNIAWALLDPEDGIAKQYGLECVRDDFELYFLTRAGMDRGTVIEYGKNLRGVSCEIDESGVATRVLPVGSDKDGKPVLLLTDPPWLTSENAGNYPTAKMYVLQCSGECRVSDTVNYTQVRAKMAEEAQALLDGGCDQPTVSMRVDFISMGDTAEYAQYKDLERVFLYDRVTVRVARLGIDVKLDVVRTVFDCLRKRYQEVELGALRDISGTIQAWQLPSDISGSKIRLNSVGAGQLSDGVIATRHLQAGSITAESAAIANAAIGTAQIQDAAIKTAKIDDAQITTAKINDAAITAAKIGSLAVTTAKINDLAVTTAKIAAAAVAYDKIDYASIASANITVAFISNAMIKDGTIQAAKIGSLNADVINAGTLATDRLLIKGANGIIYEINAECSGLTPTQLSDSKFQEYLNGTVIVAHSVTADQIAAGTITANEIAAGTITTTELAAGAIETTNISAAAQQALVLASANALNLGGLNLLKMTRNGFAGWTTWCSANAVTSWTRTVDGLGNCIRYTKSGGTVPYLVVKCFETYSKLVADTEYTISTKVANYNQECQFRLWDSADGSTWENERSIGTLPGYADGFHDFTYTFTPSATRYYRVGMLVVNLATDVDLFDTWKLEQGNKATAWSPSPDDGVKTSKIIINDDEIDMDTSLLNIHIANAEIGDTAFDRTGFHSPNVDSPSVAPRYMGPTAITVNASSAASPDGSSFRTLTDALAALSGKWLDKDVTVTVATNTGEGGGAAEYARLAGVFGSGSVTVAGGGKTVATRLGIERVGVPVAVSALTIASSYAPSSQDAVVWCAAVADVRLSGCTINGSGVGNNIDGFACRSGSARIASTNIANTRMPIAARGGRIHVDGCTGSGYYGLVAVDGGRITYNGTYPSGSGSNTFTARAGTVSGTGSASGGTTPGTPTATTTVTASSVATKTYQAGVGWMTDSTLRQGAYGEITHLGVITFGTTGWSGKTVVSGQLTLRRLNGGKGSPVTVKLKTTTAQAASGQGNPAGTTTDYGAIGTVNINNTLVCAIPAAALQEIAGGTRKSLMLYADGSADYAVFAGSDNATYKPSLTVTYNT